MNTITAKALSMCVLMSVAICAGQQVPWATFQPTPAPVQQMTNATVVQMVQAKISPDLIILAISKCEPHFLLDPGNGRYMLQMGVTDEIYKAMAARQIGKPIPGYTQAPAVAAPAAMTSAVAAQAAMAPQLGYIQPTVPQTAPPNDHSISKLSDGDVFFGFSYASADFNGLVPRQNMIGWDGRNNHGEKLASGAYIYRISVGNQTVTKKLAILH